MKRILLTALIAGSLFACNKQEGPNHEDELTLDGVLNLSVQQILPSKAISDQKGNSEYAVIASAKLYFIDGSGTSIYQRELTPAEIASIANTTTTEGAKTIIISGVPNTAQTLFFVANTKSGAASSLPPIDGNTGADARLRIDRLQGDAINAPMSGISTPFVRVGTTTQYDATVTISPIVSRLEIGQVTCENENGPLAPNVNSDITSFKLAGVFINMVRENVLLNGTPYLTGSVIDIRSQLGWASGFAPFFTSANTVFPYYVGGSPSALPDWVPKSMVNFCTPPNSALTFYPDATNGATNVDPMVNPKKAWAFQICPSNIAGVSNDVPHIILQLVDVTYDDNPLASPTQYVTVTKYKKDDNTPITTFNRANVYRITNLIFSHNQATNQPYEQNITVTALVKVTPWTINEIQPDWE